MSWKALFYNTEAASTGGPEDVRNIRRNLPTSTNALENLRNIRKTDTETESIANYANVVQGESASPQPWAVVLRDSRLGEPVVFVSDQQAAAWPEVQALGLPIFDRDELAVLASAGLEEWTTLIHVKQQIPGARAVAFETVTPTTVGSSEDGR